MHLQNSTSVFTKPWKKWLDWAQKTDHFLRIQQKKIGFICIHLVCSHLSYYTYICVCTLKNPLFLDQHAISVTVFSILISHFECVRRCVCVWLQNTYVLSKQNHVAKVYLCGVHLILMVFSQHSNVYICGGYLFNRGMNIMVFFFLVSTNNSNCARMKQHSRVVRVTILTHISYALHTICFWCWNIQQTNVEHSYIFGFKQIIRLGYNLHYYLAILSWIPLASNF